MSTAEVLDAHLASRLRERGLRVTTQRLVLHRYLSAHRSHATAEAVQRGVAGELPEISTQTVYSTLELFERLGLVTRVPTPGGSTVFDARTHPHHHLLCRVCGALQDIDADVDLTPVLEAGSATGFACEEGSVTVHGLCPACADG